MIVFSRVFSGISIAWAAALPLATLAASHRHNSSLIYLFTVLVYGTGSVLCHQLPERSFHLWGAQLPVCARCTGIYAGAAIAAAIAAGFGSTTRRRRARLGLLAAALPTIATLLYEWTSGVTPSNWIRAAAGACLGAAVGALIVAATTSPADRDEVN